MLLDHRESVGRGIGLFSCALSVIVLLSCGCSMKRYTQTELQSYTKVKYGAEYEEVIEPLSLELTTVLKELFFLKHDIAEMKEQLWAGGSNHRISRINRNIDVVRKEASKLKLVQKELLGTINQIMPGYKVPTVVAYVGNRKRYNKITGPIVLVSSEDQSLHKLMRSNQQWLSEGFAYRETIDEAMAMYRELQAKQPQGLTPMGAKGPVRKIGAKETRDDRGFLPDL